MAMSPNRRYVAMAEKTYEGPCIVIYDLVSLKRKKLLRGTGLITEGFVSIAFSPDSLYLVAQGGGPDWILIYWQWEKAKRLSTVRTSQGNPIHQISVSLHDSTQLCVTGKDTFRTYKYNEEVIKPIGHCKVDLHNFLCHSWINDERIAVGTEKGTWILINNGEPLEEHNISRHINKDTEQIDDKESSLSSEIPGVTLEGTTAIATTSKFVYVACGPGLVHCYKYNTNADKNEECKPGRKKKSAIENAGEETSYYFRVKEIRIPTDPNMSTDTGLSSNQLITQLCINPSEETLIASTASHQLYAYSLFTSELGAGVGVVGRDEEGDGKAVRIGQSTRRRHLSVDATVAEEEEKCIAVDYFRLMTQSFHEGKIVGLDICSRKPLIATCSTDHTVRIWNFETTKLELYKEFAEEAYSIALHPLGHFVLVGFSDKLRLMNLLIDDIRTFKEFPIRGCKECAFSNGGHLFAAVQGNNIQLYSSTSFVLVNTLKAHNGKIRCLLWSTDDNKLISCGMDGAVYEWDPYTGKRVNENVMKSCSYSCVTATEDAKTSYAVGSDRKVKEITDSTITLEVDSEDMLLTTIALSRSGRILICGGQEGHVRSYRFPFSNHNIWEDYVGHCDSILKMRITLNDEYLVTVSNDSSIMVWVLQERDTRNVKIERDVLWAEEVLITRSDLEEKNMGMLELRTRVDELKMENEYQLRLKDMNYSERIKELTEKFIKEMEALRVKNQTLQLEKDREEARHSEEKQEIMELHSRELKELEITSSQQMSLEVEKNAELQEKAQKMQESYESQIAEMTTAKEKMLEELTTFFETKLNEKTQLMEGLKKENREQVTEHEVTKRLIEEDADKEILDLKTQYERRLREERELIARLRGESGIMQKKFASLQKEIDEHMEELKKSHGETQKLNNVIRGQDRDIQGLKKEIQERDETIQDKEKRIYDLKKKNQELEKYKFVLSYKIAELKKQIEPRENDIRNYKEQIQEMESELERFNQQNGALDLSIEELKEKLKSTVGELKAERQLRRNIQATVRRFRIDLYNVVGKIQEPKALKESIVELYKKHIQSDVVSEVTLNEEMQREFARQRDHLERTLAGVRKKLAKDTVIHKSEFVRIMHENMYLIEEINKLRVELRNSRHRVRDLETTMAINRKQGNRAREILTEVTGHRPNPVIVAELAQANRTLHEQSHFMHLLQERLRLGAQYCLDNTSNATSGTLPPLALPHIANGGGREGKRRPATEPQSAEEASSVPKEATPRAYSVT
ncbi:WD repeat containing protein 65 [Echinococcus multilocularis]|uniref:WD repeat containing protein 65 n=1 Tax=Echinococcus multilocularis TaxID=6211 RepID=A0A068YFW8_ECHMU|nr:WD repeat containing protein 65 [Echinococcus multilocularis]